VTRLLVLGDLHCDRRHLRRLVERAVEERCDNGVRSFYFHDPAGNVLEIAARDRWPER
jgi:catechol 2,3-dioxygenase-like lactoylglutathione lyase family enzyme